MNESLIERVGALLYPPKCAVCGKLLDDGELALCAGCRMKWELEKRSLCPRCRKPHIECECGTGELRCLHLLPYTKNPASAARRTVLDAKTSNSRRLARFCARELAALLRARGVAADGGEAETVVVYVPRSARSKRLYGVDQAAAVAKLMAGELNLRLCEPLEHKRGSEQKKLGARERAENAASSYSLKKDARLRLAGRRVILYDDVTTTGSTLLSCAKLLREAGCGEVILLTLARTCGI